VVVKKIENTCLKVTAVALLLASCLCAVELSLDLLLAVGDVEAVEIPAIALCSCLLLAVAASRLLLGELRPAYIAALLSLAISWVGYYAAQGISDDALLIGTIATLLLTAAVLPRSTPRLVFALISLILSSLLIQDVGPRALIFTAAALAIATTHFLHHHDNAISTMLHLLGLAVAILYLKPVLEEDIVLLVLPSTVHGQSIEVVNTAARCVLLLALLSLAVKTALHTYPLVRQGLTAIAQLARDLLSQVQVPESRHHSASPPSPTPSVAIQHVDRVQHLQTTYLPYLPSHGSTQVGYVVMPTGSRSSIYEEYLRRLQSYRTRRSWHYTRMTSSGR